MADKTDPVCGQSIDPLRARAVAIVAGERYYFCSPGHRDLFAGDPARYIASLRPEPEVVVEVVSPAGSSPTPAPAPPPPGHVLRFEIGGMTGAEDAERVKKAIARAAGVEEVIVDRVTDVATVTVRPGVFKTALLVEAVATAGFEAAPRAAATRARRGIAADLLLGASAIASIAAAVVGGLAYAVGLVPLAALAYVTRRLERHALAIAQAETAALEPLPEVAVRPGELIRAAAPELLLVDGVVKSGEAVVDETATGGLVDAVRDAGDPVVAGTRVVRGSVVVEVRRAGADRALHRLRAAVVELASSPSSLSRLAGGLERWAVPAAIAVAGAAAIAQLAFGRGAGAAVAAGAAILVALGPVPASLAVAPLLAIAGARAARRGVLFRNAEAIERAAATRVVVLDRGATLQDGRRDIDGTATVQDMDERQLLALAAAVESGHEGPLARALRARADELGVHVPPAEEVVHHSGRGVTASIAGITVAVGSRRLAEGDGCDPAALDALAARLPERASVVYVLIDRKLAGAIGVGTRARPGVRDVVSTLRARGIRVALVTGEEEMVATSLGGDVGINEVMAGLPADGKRQAIARLRAHGPVAVIGDSVDDAAALAAADVGIAVARGAALELASGGVTVLRGDLDGAIVALDLARRAMWTLRLGLGLCCVHAILAALWLGLAPLRAAAVPLACATSATVLILIVAGAERLRRW